MAKMTLLGMTQNILNAMSSDEVNSIGDTVESLQVAEIIRETYDELFSNINTPSHDSLIQLEALSDTARPNYMRLPDTVKEIKWIKYDYRTDARTDYKDIIYLKPEEFLLLVSQRHEGIEVTDFSGGRLYIMDNVNPTYWTTFDNEYIVFDSYNSGLDASLQNSKTLCWGQQDTVFEMNDTFIPDIDADLFPLFLAEAKSVCFINLKQVSSAKEEGRARRQRVRSQNNRWRADQRRPYSGPNYGKPR